MVKVLICVDDTDDISKETSTGKVAGLIEKELLKLGGKIHLGITRHQLFLSDEIDYTSHNSSMCLEVFIQEDKINEFWDNSVKVLKGEMSQISDPGLCLCEMNKVKNIEKLIDFGLMAKEKVLYKKEAYDLAKECNVRLDEFGGTGAGVIGAIAGVGLRLFGYDGTFRGGKNLYGLEKSTFDVKELKKNLNIYQVLSKEGYSLDDDEQVLINEKIKLVYYDYKKIALVKKRNNDWIICSKSELFEKELLENKTNYECENFTFDNDFDECLNNYETCCNCLYRRWSNKGIVCCYE
ncbi:MAG: hypothetical protein ACK5LV_07940 [Lachnospirales bacterium]